MEVVTINMTTILVSWLPPDPTNGIILDYRVQVFVVTSGELFATQTIAIGASEQEDMQLVNFGGLDLENVGYRVLVSARTAIGRGSESDPESVGIVPTGNSIVYIASYTADFCLKISFLKYPHTMLTQRVLT